MKKIKEWIIRKLGGILISDIPADLCQEWLNRSVNEQIDRFVARGISEGFKVTEIE